MGTRLGAAALGLADEIGAIEAGKRADLVLFDTRRPEWQALWNPVNNLIYNTDGRSVHTVVIDGRVVVDDYRQTFVDERACSPPCRRSASACRRAPASPFPARAGLSCNGGPDLAPHTPPTLGAPRRSVAPLDNRQA